MPNQPHSGKPWWVSAISLPSRIASVDSGVTSLVKTELLPVGRLLSPPPSLSPLRLPSAWIAPSPISLEAAQMQFISFSG